jgi:hypothetical protein
VADNPASNDDSGGRAEHVRDPAERGHRTVLNPSRYVVGRRGKRKREVEVRHLGMGPDRVYLNSITAGMGY